MTEKILTGGKKGKKKNVIVFGAHPDDFEVGCAGTIMKYIKDINLKIYVMSDRYEDGKTRDLRDIHKSFKVLGLDKSIVKVFDIPTRVFHDYQSKIRNIIYNISLNVPVDVIFTTPLNDIHQDHIALAEEVLRLFREKTIFGYEVIRSHFNFRPQLHISLTEEIVEKKIKAAQCYKNQWSTTQSGGFYFSKDVMKGLMRARGAQFGLPYAEAFEVYHLKL